MSKFEPFFSTWKEPMEAGPPIEAIRGVLVILDIVFYTIPRNRIFPTCVVAPRAILLQGSDFEILLKAVISHILGKFVCKITTSARSPPSYLLRNALNLIIVGNQADAFERGHDRSRYHPPGNPPFNLNSSSVAPWRGGRPSWGILWLPPADRVSSCTHCRQPRLWFGTRCLDGASENQVHGSDDSSY